MKKENILVIHGNTNIDTELSSDARGRCNTALKLYRRCPSIPLIFCTGGLFSREQNGHRQSTVCKNYLIANGVPAEKIKEIDSVTTIDEIEKIASILKNFKAYQVYAVSSDYHCERVELAWHLLFNGINVKVVGAETAPKELTLMKKTSEILALIVLELYLRNYAWAERRFRKKREKAGLKRL